MTGKSLRERRQLLTSAARARTASDDALERFHGRICEACAEWPVRVVADAVDLSHSRVQQIVKKGRA